MYGATLRSRAVAFAAAAGLVAFVLSLLVTAPGHLDAGQYARALIPAIVCAALCWASAQRAIGDTAVAIDHAVERMARGADGDLASPIPPQIDATLPVLGSAMASLFTQLATSFDDVERLALFDPVTGLPNRVHFRRGTETMLAAMPADARGALFFVDLDRFKAVNDTRGHAVGDMLLAMVAGRLCAVGDRIVGRTGLAPPLIGRLAGDEFTLFFPEIASAQDATQIARAILFALGEPFEIAGADILIGASVGVAQPPEHGMTLTDLMRAADTAMYHAKENGRGRAEHFSDRLAARTSDRLQLEGELRDAIDRDQFALVFQPQVDLRTGRVVAAEALLRWNHPVRGLTLPGHFLTRAEESGLIVEIGQWVTGRVARTIARWQARGADHRLAINISERQLSQAGFFRRLRAALAEAGASPPLLELEIAESLAIRCDPDVLAQLADLRAAGATIAIDEFGTGASNLPRLRAFPVDRIKLARAIVADIATDAQARAVAHALVALVHGMGREAVGEGVETRAQADMLRIIGCDVIQGYAVAAPMDEPAFLDWGVDPGAVGSARAITSA